MSQSLILRNRIRSVPSSIMSAALPLLRMGPRPRLSIPLMSTSMAWNEEMDTRAPMYRKRGARPLHSQAGGDGDTLLKDSQLQGEGEGENEVKRGNPAQAPSSTKTEENRSSRLKTSFPVLRTWEKPCGGPRKGDKITVAMSGGVDSSVTLRLLASSASELAALSPPQNQSHGSPLHGFHSTPSFLASSAANSSSTSSHSSSWGDYDLRAVFMRNWSRLQSEEDHHSFQDDCEWEKDWEDVQRVCNVLGVEARLIDFSHEYWLNVFEPAIDVWQSGQTPNPDVSCNRCDAFTKQPGLLGPGREFLATGHYADLDYTPDGRARLRRSADLTKDQTYYLSSVPEEKLARAVFPLAGLRKTQVRELAHDWGLPTASREESMGVCFIGERGKFGDFVSQYTTPQDKPGQIITQDATVVGEHRGLWYYTIGQKAKVAGLNEKHFVAAKDVENNRVIIVPGALETQPNFHWIARDHPPMAIDDERGLQAKCQVRHRMQAVDVIVRRASPNSSALSISFTETPEKGVAQGQIVALWDADNRICYGSGVIGRTWCQEDVI